MQGLRAPCGRSQLDTSPVVESAIPDIIAIVVVVVVVVVVVFVGSESPAVSNSSSSTVSLLQRGSNDADSRGRDIRSKASRLLLDSAHVVQFASAF